ncbi:MAG TPA: sigma-70 family RNA polymerase sigma factor [Candidatus Limnocylindria bacterium]|nr:sigma-70 family RNA polymerase sigma factor [Candidatus Limnocylindria bacterium]
MSDERQRERLVAGGREALMERAQQGDEQAYRTLLEDVRPAVIAFLRRRITQPGELEDVAQDVLIALHRARHTYQPSRPFDPWLFGIARHVATDYVRRRVVRARRESAIPEGGLEQPILGDQAVGHDFERAWDQLSPIQREAVRLVHLEGLSLDEAAARAATTKGALKVRLHRALAAVRRVLLDGEPR